MSTSTNDRRSLEDRSRASRVRAERIGSGKEKEGIRSSPSPSIHQRGVGQMDGWNGGRVTLSSFSFTLRSALRLGRMVTLMEEGGLKSRSGRTPDQLKALLTRAYLLELGLGHDEWRASQAQYERFLTRGISYPAYVTTPEWADVRYFALRRAGYSCQYCGRGRALEVHHLTYERRGMERLVDVAVSCVVCHFDLHVGESNAALIAERFSNLRGLRSVDVGLRRWWSPMAGATR